VESAENKPKIRSTAHFSWAWPCDENAWPDDCGCVESEELKAKDTQHWRSRTKSIGKTVGSDVGWPARTDGENRRLPMTCEKRVSPPRISWL